MKFMKSMLVLPVFLFVTGCPEMPKRETTLNATKEYRQKRMQEEAPHSRFEVTITDTFHDDFAYGEKRAIYIVTDKETGREFIGISGVGIAEVGSHNVDDNSVEDER